MNIIYHRIFLKHLKKRILPNIALTKKFKARIEIFTQNPTNPILLDHALGGDYAGYRSFSITGDVRVVYKKTVNSIICIDIGSHNQLYK